MIAGIGLRVIVVAIGDDIGDTVREGGALPDPEEMRAVLTLDIHNKRLQ